MGTWGWKIFQNDDAADINATYKEKLIVGIPDIKAEDDIVCEFQLSQNINLWIPLAVTQWKLGRLSDRAKKNALVGIENELAVIHELWKPAFVEKRRTELLQTKELLNSEMPKRKKLRTPAWAYKCPWHVGNVIRYRLRYLDKSNAFSDRYVLLLIQAISETPACKIPCESIAVSLYQWSSHSVPTAATTQSMSSPERVDFVTSSGIRKPTHTILLSKQMVNEHDIQCVRKTPFEEGDILSTDVLSPMNSVFEFLVANTLK